MLTQNRKMKKSGGDKYLVYNFALPSVKTCPFAGECKKGCYGSSGMYNFSNVKAAHNRNFESSKNNDFIVEMLKELDKLNLKAVKKGKILVIRVHDNGDFYSAEYLDKWLSIMLQRKHILFYAYTKSLPYFKNVELPLNFRIIYSKGGKYDHLIDTTRHRHAEIFNSEKELEDSGYVSATNDDIIAPLNRKIGLVYHGVESKRFSTKG